MVNKWYHQIGFFILLFILQVWIFNKIHLFRVATPLFYIYFIIKLPSNMNRNLVLLLAFLTGLSIDFFNFTLGLHALASTVAGFARYYSFNLFSQRDLPERYIPSIRTLGFSFFVRYAGFILLIHEFIFFLAESFSLFDPLIILIRIISSFVLTMVLVLAFDSFHFDFSRK